MTHRPALGQPKRRSRVRGSTAAMRLEGLKQMPAKKATSSTTPPVVNPRAVARPTASSPQWEYLELLVGVGNEIWDSNGRKVELYEIQVGDPRFPRHYYSSAPLLNELGREGWEVAGVLGDLSTYIIMLKRPRLASEPVDAEEAAAGEPAHGRRASRSVAERLHSEATSST